MVLSLLWGAVWVLLGPGIAMLIVALIVGLVGSLSSLMQWAGKRKLSAVSSGLLTSVFSAAVVWLLFWSTSFTGMEVVYLAFFVSVPGFGISLLVDRFSLLEMP